jgi:hypothetical protein
MSSLLISQYIGKKKLTYTNGAYNKSVYDFAVIWKVLRFTEAGEKYAGLSYVA